MQFQKFHAIYKTTGWEIHLRKKALARLDPLPQVSLFYLEQLEQLEQSFKINDLQRNTTWNWIKNLEQSFKINDLT